MPTKEERVGKKTLVLRYDASGRLLSAKIRGVTHPWLELDPNIPAGEVHWAHFGDKSLWRDGVHYESNGGPWEAERTTKKPYEQFVAEELHAMRERLVRGGSE